jgi:hypothetical protein
MVYRGNLAGFSGILLRPLDIPFDRKPIRALSSDGVAFTRWVRSGMPKLGQYSVILDGVFFLYENKADALAGVKIGGSGFFINAPTPSQPSWRTVHAVTNWHIAVCGKPSCPVIRVNKKSGGVRVIEFDPSEWIFKPSGPDVAISPPLDFLDEDYKMTALDVASFFMTEAVETAEEYGPGDDAFMVGRFIDFDGEETNVPAVRFGHVSMMKAKIEQETLFKGRSIVVDMHSRTGFSGSPVFVYRTLGSHFMPAAQPGQVLTGGGHNLRLLGIHWGQFPEDWPVKSKALPGAFFKQAYEHSVSGFSGMTCVIPASQILEVFNLPEMIALRDENAKGPKAMAALKKAAKQPIAEGAVKPDAELASPTNDSNPSHKEDFTHLVGEAARKRPQGD